MSGPEFYTPAGREAMAAVYRFVERASVPIIIGVEEGVGIQGAGTLFTVSDSLYLVTAAHVLQDQDLQTLHVPSGPEHAGAELLPLAGAEVLLVDDDAIDVGLIRIEGTTAHASLSDSWVVISTENLSANTAGTTWFIVAGWPQATAEVSPDSLRAEFYATVTSAYSGQTDKPSDPEVDLLLHYGRRTVTDRGDVTETPPLGGISGSSVWLVPNDFGAGVWSPSTHVKVCAVQTGMQHGSYVRAKKWHLVARILQEADPVASEMVLEALR